MRQTGCVSEIQMPIKLTIIFEQLPRLPSHKKSILSTIRMVDFPKIGRKTAYPEKEISCLFSVLHPGMVDTGVGGDTSGTGHSIVILTAAPPPIPTISAVVYKKKLPVIVWNSKPPSQRQIEMNKYHRRKSRKCHGNEDDV